jgi:hypothetical protein
MKALLLIVCACAATLLTGCHTVAVVDDGPHYARSGYYRQGYYSHSRPYYYSHSRPYYSRSRAYYGGDRYYRTGYYGDRSYSRYPSRSGATVVIR